MLDGTLPWGAVVTAYRSPHIVTACAREPWQRAEYWALRSRVFVEEQRLFEGTDRDAKDAAAIPIVAMSAAAGMLDQVVGTVRIYRRQAGEWWGGRLAVLPAYRVQGDVGAALIRTAVGGARRLGCDRFLATVQSRNARYFQRHHFRPLEPRRLHGQAHWLMEADLGAFPVLAAFDHPLEEAA